MIVSKYSRCIIHFYFVATEKIVPIKESVGQDVGQGVGQGVGQEEAVFVDQLSQS